MDNSDDWDDDSCFLPSEKVISLDVDTFRKDMIAAHNHYRCLHDSPPLEHLQELEDTAQLWAEKIATKGHLEYCEKLKKVGESLIKVDLNLSSVPSAKEIVRKWYREIKEYTFAFPRWRREQDGENTRTCILSHDVSLGKDWNMPKFEANLVTFRSFVKHLEITNILCAFHFTQMVWRSSRHIGIGIAPVPGEPRLFIVVRYYPGGNSNYPGEFQRNVQPRVSLKSTDSFFQDDSSFVRTYSGRFRSISSEDAYI